MRFPGFLLISSLLISPAMASEFEVTAGAEYFRWEEFDDSGRKMLKETGPRYFVGLKGINDLSQEWRVDFGGRFYSGSVDYDGETQPIVYPVTTQTDYNGVRIELGYTHGLGSESSENLARWLLRFAIGLDHWRRSLHDTEIVRSNGTVQNVPGYVERYISTYGKVGVAYHAEKAFSVGLGAKAPFYTREEVIGYPGVIGTIELNPEGQLSLFADVLMPLNEALSVAIEYDGYRFAKSDPEAGFEQPKSTQDTLGLALRYRF